MTDLSSAWAIKAKGLLFLCFCRFYYFAFYVIERYVDPGYRFSGLWAFARYLLRRSGKTDS